MQIDGQKILDSATEAGAGMVNGKLNEFEEGINKTAETMRGFVSTGEGEKDVISQLLEWLQGIFKWIRKAIGGWFDKAGSQAEELMSTAMKGAEGVWNKVDKALGLSSAGTALGEMLNANYKDFMKNGLPKVDSENGQRETLRQIIKLRSELTDFYIDKLSKQYPEVARVDPDRITASAEKAAGIITGIESLPETSNETILLNTVEAPKAGSYGAFLMKSQSNIRGLPKDTVPDASNIPAINIDTAALAAVVNDLKPNHTAAKEAADKVKPPAAAAPAPAKDDSELSLTTLRTKPAAARAPAPGH